MITSTGNARVKQLVTWQKKRKARDEEGVYIVEGIRMYREAPRAQVREVYVSEQFTADMEKSWDFRHGEDRWKSCQIMYFPTCQIQRHHRGSCL